MVIFTYILAGAALYYLTAIQFLHRGLHSLKPSGAPQGLTFSIVIAARNEERNIGTCLDAVFAQTLPADRYEVIVVNDRSADATGAICADYAQRYRSMTVITISETPVGQAPKKHAVVRGVDRARHQVVVLTDADCIVPPEWLATIDRNFAPGVGLVQGITAYSYVEGMNRFFYGMQAVDFLSHGVVAAAAIGAGMPLNSNANNFAFRKETFEAAGGYGDAARRIVSGDDDLLLQRIAKSGSWRVTFMTDPAGAVATAPTPTLRGVFEQRKRWGSKTVNYTKKQFVFLSGIFLFYCGLVGALFLGLFSPVYLVLFGAMLAVKTAGDFMLMLPGTALFNRKRLRPYILPASLIQAPLVLAAVVAGVFGKFSWKGEEFRRAVK